MTKQFPLPFFALSISFPSFRLNQLCDQTTKKAFYRPFSLSKEKETLWDANSAGKRRAPRYLVRPLMLNSLGGPQNVAVSPAEGKEAHNPYYYVFCSHTHSHISFLLFSASSRIGERERGFPMTPLRAPIYSEKKHKRTRNSKATI